MNQYLGEELVETDPNLNYALLWIEKYSGIDGEHHKAWVIDQVARILLGTSVETWVARWNFGAEPLEEYRYTLGPASQAYYRWREIITDEGEYGYDEGIAP